MAGESRREGGGLVALGAEVRVGSGRVSVGCSLRRANQTGRKLHDRGKLVPLVHASPKTDGTLRGRRFVGPPVDGRANCTPARPDHLLPCFLLLQAEVTQ